MNRIKFLSKTTIWSDSTVTSKEIASIEPGTVTDYEYDINGWYKIKEFHWVYLYNENGKKALVKTEEDINIDNIKINYFNKELDNMKFHMNLFGPNSVTSALETTLDQTLQGFRSSINAILGNIDNNPDVNRLQIEHIQGIFGIPYQFMPSVDARIPEGNGNGLSKEQYSDNFKDFGRKYYDKIVQRIPLLIMQPGEPLFMAGYDDTKKNQTLEQLIKSEALNHLDKLSADSEFGRYYSFMPAWNAYSAIVTPMCKLAAIYMGLNEYIDKDSSFYRQSSMAENVFNLHNSVAFYLNSESQISESFSNNTGQSQLAGALNQISDQARELQFLIGSNKNMVMGNAANEVKNMISRFGQGAAGTVTGMLSSGQTLFGAISNSISTFIAGGKMMLPEIWNDSSFSRSFTLNIKLISPDNDDESIFLNIIVPLMHLVGLVSPRASGPNAYVSPFLIKSCYRSFFNVDLGIITDMAISKGAEGSWNHLGIPTVAEVQFQIKELLPQLVLSNSDNNVGTNCKLEDNQIMMDYISNLCGVNLMEPDMTRFVKQKIILSTQKYKDSVLRNTFYALSQKYYTSLFRLFGYS